MSAQLLISISLLAIAIAVVALGVAFWALRLALRMQAQSVALFHETEALNVSELKNEVNLELETEQSKLASLLEMLTQMELVMDRNPHLRTLLHSGVNRQSLSQRRDFYLNLQHEAHLKLPQVLQEISFHELLVDLKALRALNNQLNHALMEEEMRLLLLRVKVDDPNIHLS